MTKTRLNPTVFKVPIDKIRAGYYSDKYFLRVSEILRKEQHNPTVLYQFFVRKPAVVVGCRYGKVYFEEEGVAIS